MNINIGSLDAEYVVDWRYVCVAGLWVWRLCTVCWRPVCVRISTCARISSLCCSGRPVWAVLKASLHCCRPPLEGCERPWRLRVRVTALSHQRIKNANVLLLYCCAETTVMHSLFMMFISLYLQTAVDSNVISVLLVFRDRVLTPSAGGAEEKQRARLISGRWERSAGWQWGSVSTSPLTTDALWSALNIDRCVCHLFFFSRLSEHSENEEEEEDDDDSGFSWLKEMGVQDKIKKPDAISIKLYPFSFLYKPVYIRMSTLTAYIVYIHM